MQDNFICNVSVDSFSKTVIGRTDTDFSKLKPHGYIKFYDDVNLYQIKNTNKLIVYYKFDVINPKQIRLKDKNPRPTLMEEDVIPIYYEEYEFKTLLGIINGGKNYKKGNTLILNGGSPSYSNQEGRFNKTQFDILEVDESGAITQLALKEKGVYTKTPEQFNTFITENSGHGAELDLQYVKLLNRSNIERTIFKIEGQDLFLNYELPSGINSGIISLEKWTLSLHHNYENNIYNKPCEIVNNFTDYLKLIILLPNSLARDNIINRNIILIDSELKKMDQRLSSIEKQLAILG